MSSAATAALKNKKNKISAISTHENTNRRTSIGTKR
jgi:hypothetical protein